MKNHFELMKNTYSRHGLLDLAYLYFLKAINKIFSVKVLSCILISKVKPSALLIDPKFEHGFLDVQQLLSFSNDKANELSDNFLVSAIKKGDECYAITDDGEIAGYGWYSKNETLTDVQQLKFCFDPSYVYMYKGLTKDNYRGQRLHAAGMSWALHRYLEKGFKGIVSYVESTNFDSLKSCYRMGYEKVGSIIVFKVFGRVYHYSSKPCQKLNVRLQ